jgi:hypothetical protein
LEEFEKAHKKTSKSLQRSQTIAWAEAGVEIAEQTVRSWEAAAQYFKVSPEILGYMSFSQFIGWTECGSSLCKDSPSLATSYFDASPGAISKLKLHDIEGWADLGRSLYKGTWKSSTLACKFYSTSPALLDSLTYTELKSFVTFLGALSQRSYDLSAECLTLGHRLFPLIGEDKEAFIALASTLVESGWRDVKSFFEAGSKALPKIEASQRLRFMGIVERLVKSGGTNISSVMLDISESLNRLDPESHAHLIGLAESLLAVYPPAVPEFIKMCPRALERVTMAQLDGWFEEGVRLLNVNQDGGFAYFKIESAHSEEVLEALSSGVEYERIKGVMEMYCRGLAGAQVKLATSGELAEKKIGWVSNESPSTEGSTVFTCPGGPLHFQGRELLVVQGCLDPPGGPPGVWQLPLRV